jgi:hypothetical protein
VSKRQHAFQTWPQQRQHEAESSSSQTPSAPCPTPQVRLLADVLLERLGFASLVVHLAPVAAALGNGSTSAVVVDMGSSGTSICCVDDAVVLPPVSSRVNLALGLTRIAAALVGWMGCYGHWPAKLQQAAGGPSLGCVVQQQQQQADDDNGAGSSSSSSTSSVGAVDVYCCLMLEELVMQHCYFPKVRPRDTPAAAAGNSRQCFWASTWMSGHKSQPQRPTTALASSTAHIAATPCACGDWCMMWLLPNFCAMCAILRMNSVSPLEAMHPWWQGYGG